MSEDHTALAAPPIACGFCSGFPTIVRIAVNYATPRKSGVHEMYRAHCSCGAIGKCRPTPEAAAESWNEPWQALVGPIPMVLHCPRCGLQHIDEPEPAKGWDNPPHRSHLCHGCGAVWRPASVATTGVARLEAEGTRDTWAPGEPVLREFAGRQTALVDRVCSAVERGEQDVGGEGALTVLRELGPVNDQLLALLRLR